ncbi:hypothetical protein D9619_000017 [Psilocybe cf. subviscida]|uniref:Uncharacterized protein n=1 Tax=Psilocybe cf. subviscida TaxID=2480587 RepID=A0A8H5BEZ6_9AGAR|nr:hypothetical protein D9619_000017 [Psilocybe cf. subviscida]
MYREHGIIEHLSLLYSQAHNKRVRVGGATLMRAFNLTHRVTPVTPHVPLSFKPSLTVISTFTTAGNGSGMDEDILSDVVPSNIVSCQPSQVGESESEFDEENEEDEVPEPEQEEEEEDELMSEDDKPAPKGKGKGPAAPKATKQARDEKRCKCKAEEGSLAVKRKEIGQGKGALSLPFTLSTPSLAAITGGG